MKLLGRIKKKIINDTQYPIQYTIFNIQLTGHIYGIQFFGKNMGKKVSKL